MRSCILWLYLGRSLLSHTFIMVNWFASFFLCVHVIPLIVASRTNGTNEKLAGIRARISRNGLDYASILLVDFMMQNPGKIKLPEIVVSVGGNTMTLSNMVIRQMPRPLLKLISTPANELASASNGNRTNGQLLINITDLHPVVDTRLKIERNWRFLSIEREFNITTNITDMKLELRPTIGIDQDGRPWPTDIQCHATGDISFQLTGEYQNWNWLVSSVYNAMKNRFRESMFEQVCFNIVEEITKFIENDFKTAPMAAVFENDFVFDYRLLVEPKFTERFLETSHDGLIKPVNATEEPDFKVPVIPPSPQHFERMVYLYITDSAANSGWHAALVNGRLNISINENMTQISQEARQYLRTTCPGSTCLGSTFPHLSMNYPNAVATVNIQAVQSPYRPFRFQGRSIRTRCTGVADFYVDTAPGSREKIFTISLVLAGKIELNITGQKLYFNVPARSFRLEGDILSTPPSFTGLIPVMEPILDSTMNFLSTYVVLPALQALGNSGLPLEIPTLPDLKFFNTYIVNEHSAQHFIALGTDLEYTLPEPKQTE